MGRRRKGGSVRDWRMLLQLPYGFIETTITTLLESKQSLEHCDGRDKSESTLFEDKTANL